MSTLPPKEAKRGLQASWLSQRLARETLLYSHPTGMLGIAMGKEIHFLTLVAGRLPVNQNIFFLLKIFLG
jgi:hypothetical protein